MLLYSAVIMISCVIKYTDKDTDKHGDTDTHKDKYHISYIMYHR